VGLYLVFNRDRLVKAIDNRLQNKKINDYKKARTDGLKTTLKKITPKKSLLKLDIKSKTSIKDKLKSLKVKKKSNPSKGYIEIK